MQISTDMYVRTVRNLAPAKQFNKTSRMMIKCGRKNRERFVRRMSNSASVRENRASGADATNKKSETGYPLACRRSFIICTFARRRAARLRDAEINEKNVG